MVVYIFLENIMKLARTVIAKNPVEDHYHRNQNLKIWAWSGNLNSINSINKIYIGQICDEIVETEEQKIKEIQVCHDLQLRKREVEEMLQGGMIILDKILKFSEYTQIKTLWYLAFCL